MTSKEIANNAIICAIYVALTLVNPIGWGIMQFRISEIISVIPFYNRKYIPGVLSGVAIANLFSPLGFIDVFVGLVCGIITYIFSKRINNNIINSLIFAVVCGILVGMELKMVLNLPFLLSMMSVTLSTIGTSILGLVIIENTRIYEKIRE